jgi:adenine phosphoribosyltransferase
MDLTAHIRAVPDFPKPGILFRDITPLLAEPAAFAAAIDQLVTPWLAGEIDAVAAVEARGFLFAAPLALRLGVGLIPVRKPGKLPAETVSYSYDLEYGSDTLEMHRGIVKEAARVLVIDDVLATGGTAEACVKLLGSSGATVAGCGFLVELEGLGGRDRLSGHRVETVLTY